MSDNAKSPGSIPLWLRIVLGLASGGSAVVGYFAIMRPDTPEVGGVAFVALAGLFAVLAVIGRVPQKVNAGSMGVEFGEAERLVKAAEPLPPESRIELAESLRDRPGVSPAQRLASEAIQSSAEFEQLVISTLDKRGWLEAIPSEPRDLGVDAIINIDGKRYAVEVKALRRDLVQGATIIRLPSTCLHTASQAAS
jgi:hypothetical protein